jgi:hypothetical protein
MRRHLVITVIAAAAILLGSASPAAAGDWIIRTATINPNPAIWEWITPEMHSDNAGEDLFFRTDRLPEPLYVKWVKCGYTATQDAASSVGGQAKLINNESTRTIGTNFIANACVRLWARATTQLSYRPSYPMEAYFHEEIRP